MFFFEENAKQAIEQFIIKLKKKLQYIKRAVELEKHFVRFIENLLYKDDLKLNQLNSLYGVAKPPMYFYESEIIENIQVVQKPVFQMVSNYDDGYELTKRPNLNKNITYIYAVDEQGDIIIGEEYEDDNGAKIGHPTLQRSLWARIAGEIYNKNSAWYINSKSGRYESDQVENHLNNVSKQLSNILGFEVTPKHYIKP